MERLIKNLYEDQAIALGQTLIEFEGVFAKDALDIDCFSGGIECDIDMGDTKANKSRIHHTPIGFQAEEEKHLEKLIKLTLFNHLPLIGHYLQI